MRLLLVTELIFALVLRRFWIHQSILLVTWVGGALACVGLAVLLVVRQAQDGQPTPASHHWIAAGVTCSAGRSLGSIVRSVWLFDERFIPDPVTLTVAAVAFAVMCAGVVLLTQTAPATMEADTG